MGLTPQASSRAGYPEARLDRLAAVMWGRCLEHSFGSFAQGQCGNPTH